MTEMISLKPVENVKLVIYNNILNLLPIFLHEKSRVFDYSINDPYLILSYLTSTVNSL